MDATHSQPVRLGLRANAGQFALLVGINGLVGAMVGQERTLLPLLGRETFGLTGASVALTFLIAFGVTKAVANLLAGFLADRYGRKPVLVSGWVIALPVPLLIIWAPSWGWIVFANVLLGVSQGLTWSTTVLMKVDLVGPARRGLALGLNEAAGYGAVALAALATGMIAASHGLRPTPFFIGIVVAGLGLGASVLFVRETRAHAWAEARDRGAAPRPSWPAVFRRTTFGHRSLSAASQAGLVNNLNDGLAWGLLPLFYAAAGLTLPEIAVLAAAYPAVWGLGQLVTGALSDRTGRKGLIVGGMVVQGLALVGIGVGSGFGTWLLAAIALGVGTAMVYPTLLAVIVDVAEPSWRGAALGVYRLWRDLGFAIGAILAGLVADRFGMPVAIIAVGVLTVASGVVVARRLVETGPGSRRA
ncbi:MAG: MFS transporter [Chloroflexi bacterium]|nr:MFS transporter [Chloroflexota bacterium]